MPSNERDLPVSAAAAQAALEEAAAAWGGDWVERQGKRLLWLPVSVGIRRGFVLAGVVLDETRGGSRVTLEPEESHLELNRGAAGVLALGALGGIVAMLWPFYPNLLRLAPFGAILAVVAWLMVAGRLRSRDTRQFLDLVETVAAAGPGEPSEPTK